MKIVRANLFAIPVKIKINTSLKSKNDKWAMIICIRTGRILHTGQLAYIKRVAKNRYNVQASL